MRSSNAIIPSDYTSKASCTPCVLHRNLLLRRKLRFVCSCEWMVWCYFRAQAALGLDQAAMHGNLRHCAGWHWYNVKGRYCCQPLISH